MDLLRAWRGFMSLRDKPIWAGVILLGTISHGIVASTRGGPVNAAWLVVAAVCIYFIAHRFYALYITRCAFRVDATRLTPAWRRNDGLDYVPTHRVVLFGHHFAAIAGAGLSSDRCLLHRWAFARHAVDTGRRRVRRSSTGHDGPLPVDAPRWPVAGRHGPQRSQSCG